ncbi:hybrid sensor histidine kinase/response regulator [uncultured Alsobacter sp.]|uniref:hybrid sensor histidine kinase/response regulator n=1 Tax=uncultured Alsobacter sp. TaxID=1748258 RepID=UPI0025E2E6B8|nr:hybrid sensor histidine kinase/response regulator [uncultured Alsobacter sp.]
MRQLRVLVYLSVILPILVFGVAATFAWFDKNAAMHAAVQHTLDLVAEHALKTFDTYALVAEQAGEIVRDMSDDEIRANEPLVSSRLARLERSLPQLQDIWLIDAVGRPLATAQVYPVPVMDLADRTYFKVHRDAPRAAYVSELLRGRAMDVVFFQVSWRRSSSQGDFAGVTAVSVQPDYFREFHGRVASAEGIVVAMLREDGTVLVQHPERSNDLQVESRVWADMAALFKRSPRGTATTHSAREDEERYTAYRKLGDYPVYVSASVATSSVVLAWLHTLAGYLLVGIPATAALFLLSLKALGHMQSEVHSNRRFQEEAARREAAEATLRQIQKMEAVGRITGGVAHDFNNLLTVVIGNLDILIRRLGPDDARARRSASLAKEGAVRASLLTQRLLAFSRQQPLEPRRVEINALVTGMSDLTRRTLGESITVVSRTEPGVWPVDIDPNQLENAILNLAVNARDAMPDGGILTIATRNEHVGQQGPHPDDPAPGDHVVISVSDTGMGIAEETLPKVFEPFFTTKPHGKGTGLGLSQVYGFIKQSGGQVRMASVQGAGTTVSLFLPRAHGEAPATDDPGPAATGGALARRDDRRVVLVVEDEVAVRAFSVEALRELGFEVVEAGDAASALAVLGQRPDVHLVFSDIGLPGTDGRTLAGSILAARPHIRVLLTSGYENQIADAAASGDFMLLPKPFTVEELAQKIAEVLA